MGPAQINQSINQWCNKIANRRKWPTDRSLTVYQKWMSKRPKLIKCPTRFLHPKEMFAKRSGKYPQISFDLNFYSIPPEYLGLNLILQADDEVIEILFDGKIIARHKRSFSRNQNIDDQQHRQTISNYKHYGKANYLQQSIINDFPEAKVIFERLFDQGYSTHIIANKLNSLHREYGEKLLNKALLHAVASKSYNIDSLRYFLQKLQKKHKIVPKISIQLPDKEEIKGLHIKSHSLDQYDKI
ncbi:MAG: hypothetical protein R3B45_01280 [Bdellovibrionota bacterium]